MSLVATAQIYLLETDPVKQASIFPVPDDKKEEFISGLESLLKEDEGKMDELDALPPIPSNFHRRLLLINEMNRQKDGKIAEYIQSFDEGAGDEEGAEKDDENADEDDGGDENADEIVDQDPEKDGENVDEDGENAEKDDDQDPEKDDENADQDNVKSDNVDEADDE